VIALGIDPGSTSFGYSVVSYSKKMQPKVLETGTLTNTVRSLVKAEDPEAQAILFSNEVDSIIIRHKVKRVAAERYQNRGIKGSQIELVSMMLAKFLYDSMYEGVPITFVTAAQWKNRINRVHDLKQMYVDGKMLKIEPHEIDASLIAMYDGCNLYGLEHFHFMTETKSLLANIQKVSINVRGK